jgi:hypothetical protein
MASMETVPVIASESLKSGADASQFAPEPAHELVDLDKEPIEWDKLRVFGYYVAQDMVKRTVKRANGRRFRLPDGRAVIITRMWCTLTEPFDNLAKWLMTLYPVDEKPPADAFVADVSDARLLAVHCLPHDDGGAGWHETANPDDPSPLERIRRMFETKEYAPEAIIVVTKTPDARDDHLDHSVVEEPAKKKARTEDACLPGAAQ